MSCPSHLSALRPATVRVRWWRSGWRILIALSPWVTLDENDSNLSSFLAYLVAAIETVDPTACAHIREVTDSSSMPAVETLAALVANDLDALSTEIVLVLDDYQFISDLEVHELITTLLRYPPAPVQWALLTRFDPPLPLQVLRGTRADRGTEGD